MSKNLYQIDPQKLADAQGLGALHGHPSHSVLGALREEWGLAASPASAAPDNMASLLKAKPSETMDLG